MLRNRTKNSDHLSSSKSNTGMDTKLMFKDLLDHNASKRVDILMVMRKLLKNGDGYLPFDNTSLSSLFDVLYNVLDDTRWEVRYQCLLLISAIIGHNNEEVDSCMPLVMPKIVADLGHDNVNVRRAALQVLHIHMKYTNNLQHFQNMFIQYGLENQDYIIRKGCIMSIGILFSNDFESENLFPLVECLAKHFVEGDASLFYPIFLAMQKINELVGSLTFDVYLQKLDEEASNTYKRVLNKFTLQDSRLSSSSGSRSSFSSTVNGSTLSTGNKLLKYDFGIFQPYIIEKVKSEDWKTRIEAIEHMKILIREMTDFNEKISDMDEFMVFLSKLLEDVNFKIVIQTLSVYDLLIDKFKNQMKRFLKTFVNSILKRLGDVKVVVREHAIKVIHKLMHHVRPTDVLGNLLQCKENRNPRLREEILNRVTAAVLTFPSYNFEFTPLCEAVAPLLADTRRRVRLSALECFSALAQAMGPMRMVPLVSAVDAIEINCDAEGLLNAVQARLARRILPRCNEDGAVSYAVTLPSSAGCQNRSSSPWGADIEWIMAASGSSSSSTPPSRSKDVTELSTIHLNEDSSRRKPSSHPKSKSQAVGHVKMEENMWVNNGLDELVFHPIKQTYEVTRSTTVQGKEIVEDSCVESHLIDTDKHDESLVLINIMSSNAKSPQNGSVKTRPVIMNSKIPVLTNFPTKKNSETVLPKLVSKRALSAERHYTLPNHQTRYSASQRPSHFIQQDQVQAIHIRNGNKEAIMRKISPSCSPLGAKPILVRSPSLNSLGQLNGDADRSLYRGCSGQPMGNVAAYFRPVVVAQPSPLHLDDVNVFSVAVLDNASTMCTGGAEGWEMMQPGTAGSAQMDNWQSNPSVMPDVYEMHVNSPIGYGQKVVSSPLSVDNGNISIAKITREKMLRRQQEILKEAEERRLVREREEEEEQKGEADNESIEECSCSSESMSSHIEEDLAAPQEVGGQSRTGRTESKIPPPKVSAGISFVEEEQAMKRTDSTKSREDSSKPLSRSSSLKTPSTLRKYAQSQTLSKNSQTSRYSLAASSLALFDESSQEVATYPNPSEVLKKAMKSISSDTWMGKIEGIRTIQRLAKNHSNVIQLQLHSVILALLAEVKNLRSSVSRAAILAVGDLFLALKKNMEQDLDLVTSTLLSKCGETAGFIRDDIEKVMRHLVDTITPNKAALSIIAGGASHRNGAVRKVAAQSLLEIVEKMGPTRIMTSAKDVAEKLIPITAQFLMDGTPHTRYYGRRIYHLLMQHPVFDKMLLRYVQPNTLRNINSILDSIRKKGPGEKPKEGVLSKTHKSEAYRSSLLNRTM